MRKMKNIVAVKRRGVIKRQRRPTRTSHTNSRILSEIYKNPANVGSYSGVDILYKQAKIQNPSITLDDVKKWLKTQDTYTLHKQSFRKFPRNNIYVSGIDSQWELDLVDMQNFSKYNDGFKYMLVCIDIFSKYAWVEPLKSKSSKNVCEAFENILSKGRKPWRIRTDKGKEFVNVDFKNLLKEEGIEFFTSQNEDIKCAVVERFNRTLKNRMWRYFTEKNTLKWIDIVQQLVSSYNDTFHRSIKEKPRNVNFDNEEFIRNQLYPKKEIKKPRLLVGDYVRMSKYRQKFDKGYLPQWTEELFIIYKVLHRRTESLYELKDLQGERIEGTFYEKELQKVVFDNRRTYKIEKVLKRRKASNGRIQLFVKWRGYPEKFNEWIDESDLS